MIFSKHTMKIDWIIERVEENEYYFSRHGDQERQDEDLTIAEIEESILSGRMLEVYENTGRGRCCLVAGFSNLGKPVHIVCGRRGDQLVIITVYIPRPPKFKTPYERGEK